jgi:hypothetical protein
MTRIDGLGPAPQPGVAVRGVRRRGDFTVSIPDNAAEAAESTPLAEPVASGVLGLVALQSGDIVDPEADTVQDRAARRRARDILDALGTLQRAMLTDGPVAASLEHLSTLTRDVEGAADPALRAAIEAVVLRARVELARHAVT